jgi:hypothetical protein
VVIKHKEGKRDEPGVLTGLTRIPLMHKGQHPWTLAPDHPLHHVKLVGAGHLVPLGLEAGSVGSGSRRCATRPRIANWLETHTNPVNWAERYRNARRAQVAICSMRDR